MRQKVLIVTRGDEITVYGDKDIDVRIVEEPLMDSVAGELAAEKYVERKVPIAYRHLFFEGSIRAEGRTSHSRPYNIAQRDWEVEFVRALDKVEDLLSTPF